MSIVAVVNKSNCLQIPRIELPQIDFADISDILHDFKAEGISFKRGTIKAGALKPSQDQLNVDKIASMIESGKDKEDRTLFISRENFIVDGHHYWGAKSFKNSDEVIKVIKVDLNIVDLINWFKLNNKNVSFKTIKEGKTV